MDYSLSDVRFKTNIRTIDDALSRVTRMRGVTYTLGGRRGVGVIAQEMEKVRPEVVGRDEDGFMYVSYSHLVGDLIEAVKELSDRLDKLESR